MSTEAVVEYKQVSQEEVDASTVLALISNAKALAYQSQNDEAKRFFSQALAIQPLHPEANHAYGMLQAKLVDVLAAEPYFEKAVKADPTSEQYWVSYIDALMLSNQFDKARSTIALGLKHGLSDAFAEQLHLECDQAQTQESVQHHPEQSVNPGDFKQALSQMIASNVREVAEYQSSRKIGINNRPLSADINTKLIEPFIEYWVEQQYYDQVLTIIDTTISELVQTPMLVGHKIFTPYFDQLLAKFDYQISNVISRDNKTVNLILASELYDYGGHTKEIVTMINQVENPVMVITDVYSRAAEQKMFEKVAHLFPECPVILLPKENPLAKSKRLAALINQLAKNVFLFVHHNDSVAIAACQSSLSTNYYFVHHADHNASLGNHTKHFQHIDLFAGLAKNCAEDLNSSTVLLPTSAKDLGAKAFSNVKESCSTVTAGTFGKFKTEGAFSLSSIIIHSIKQTQSSHYHFGTIPDKDLYTIQQDLINAGLDAKQFIYKGNVPSLWEGLKDIDAHIFIGSAPVRGGKSEIEAQGVGYPLLLFKSLECPRHLNIGSNAKETTYWHDIESFVNGLSFIRQNHTELTAASRQFYANHCTPENYQSVLAALEK